MARRTLNHWRRSALPLALAAALAAALAGCHSTEANYKMAYDKAMEKYREGVGREEYDRIRAEAMRMTDVINGDSVRLLRMHANVVLDSAAVARRYSVVIAAFRQQFNAQAMRDRLRQEEGLPSYVLFGGSERKYYVAVKGFDDRQLAGAFLQSLDTALQMPVLEPVAWILEKF